MESKELYRYWTYYKVIEKEFLRLSEIIEIDKAHFGVFSRELIKLLVLTCSEVDTIFRVLREIDKPGTGDDNLDIGDHYNLVAEHHYFLFLQSISVSPYDITLQPFGTWKAEKAPFWWTGYNKVKHQRRTDYKAANLENCLNAGAALVALLLTAQTTISDDRLPMDPGIELEFFGTEFNYNMVVSLGSNKFNGK